MERDTPQGNEGAAIVGALTRAYAVIGQDDGDVRSWEQSEETIRADAARRGFVTVERHPHGESVTVALSRPGPAGSVPFDLPDGTLVEFDRATPSRVCGVTVMLHDGEVPDASVEVVRTLFGTRAAEAVRIDEQFAAVLVDASTESVRRELGRAAIIDAERDDLLADGITPSGLWDAEAAAALVQLPPALNLRDVAYVRARVGADALAGLVGRLPTLGDPRAVRRAKSLATTLCAFLGPDAPADVVALASGQVARRSTSGAGRSAPGWLSRLLATIGLLIDDPQLVGPVAVARSQSDGVDELSIPLAAGVRDRVGLKAGAVRLVLSDPITAVVPAEPDSLVHDLWLRTFSAEGDSWTLLAIAPFVLDDGQGLAEAVVPISTTDARAPSTRFDVTDRPSRAPADSPAGRLVTAQRAANRAIRAAAEGWHAESAELWESAGRCWATAGDLEQQALSLRYAHEEYRLAGIASRPPSASGGWADAHASDAYHARDAWLPELVSGNDAD